MRKSSRDGDSVRAPTVHNLVMSEAKRAAGRRAAELIRDGLELGLGTGSTVDPFLEALAARIEGEGLRVRGVPTSRQTERRARELGIPLATLDEVGRLDLTVDGADEIDPAFDMIKGGGGALLREKVVASVSQRVVIVVDQTKRVDRLGTTFALPVEVVKFAVAPVRRALALLGCDPILRERNGGVFESDNGNAVLDCRFAEGIADARALHTAAHAIPGVVEVGLFLGLAHGCIVGFPDGRSELTWKPGEDPDPSTT